ncbi:MAG: hypothetical protein MJ062_07145 [Oscillospiraceae bacterium]|nr:hypothetical protein [Oscillospiraceae bacterium]
MEHPPTKDIFAAQGTLALLTAVFLLVLHLFAPDFCAELFVQWRCMFEQSAPLSQIAAQIREWTAAWFA